MTNRRINKVIVKLPKRTNRHIIAKLIKDTQIFCYSIVDMPYLGIPFYVLINIPRYLIVRFC